MPNAWNLLIGTPRWSDVSVAYTPVLSGGSWQAALPLANLQESRLDKVARSSDATAASTKFDCDLGVARAVRLLGLVKHNLTSAATVRFRGYSDAGYTTLVYDSTTFNAWPSGVTAETYDGYVKTALHVAASDQTARYWRTEITDTANPAGYVDVARLLICGGLQASINLSYGARAGWQDDSTRSVTDGGPAVYDRRAKRRTLEGTIENLPDDEAMAGFFELQRREGLTGQVVVIYDPSETNWYRRSMLAVQRQLSPLEAAVFGRDSVPLAFVEEL